MKIIKIKENLLIIIGKPYRDVFFNFTFMQPIFYLKRALICGDFTMSEHKVVLSIISILYLSLLYLSLFIYYIYPFYPVSPYTLDVG